MDAPTQQTNSSSIVSKRSVEKLYYPAEPPFFRHFVKKFQRRAPLINRGYWLRLRAIDVLVRDFLRGVKARGRRGVVVNLGCGRFVVSFFFLLLLLFCWSCCGVCWLGANEVDSDVLPWQCLTRYLEECGGVKFVDVDFPDLIERKRQTVLGTPELAGMFTGVKEAAGLAVPVVFESDQYVQIGCDLRELERLRQGLAVAVGDFNECEFIFVAEVSITYMEREGADEVIRWASTVGRGEYLYTAQAPDLALLTFSSRVRSPGADPTRWRGPPFRFHHAKPF